MMTAPDDPTLNRKVRDALLSPGLRSHLLIAGVALFAAGTVALWLLPEFSPLWVLVTIIVAGHIGLLMMTGAAALRWVASRFRDR